MPRKLKVLLFGATGMVGQGVLRECLRDPDVEQVRVVGRTRVEQTDSRLDQLILDDLSQYAAVESQLVGFDACFWCLGTSALGQSEADYTRITYGLTAAAAQTLARVQPRLCFVFVSAVGADSSERGRLMWARVKGRTENMLFRLPLRASFMFRPGAIQPLDGVHSRTLLYRVGYALAAPIIPLLRRWKPSLIVTTEEMGLAMLYLVRRGAAKRVLENKDIRAVANRARERANRMQTHPDSEATDDTHR